MVAMRWFPARGVEGVLGLLTFLVVSACATTPTGTAAFFCTTSIGDLPVFQLPGSQNPFTASRPSEGGVTQLEIAIVVDPGAFDYADWDVLDLIGYNQPPDSMEFIIEYGDPNTGWPDAEDALLKINVYSWTPPGEYGLKVRGLAYTGEFFTGEGVLVGECFRTFVVSVQ